MINLIQLINCPLSCTHTFQPENSEGEVEEGDKGEETQERERRRGGEGGCRGGGGKGNENLRRKMWKRKKNVS